MLDLRALCLGRLADSVRSRLEEFAANVESLLLALLHPLDQAHITAGVVAMAAGEDEVLEPVRTQTRTGNDVLESRFRMVDGERL